MPDELGRLYIIVDAQTADAIANMKNMDKSLADSGMIAQKQGEKMETQQKKVQKGWGQSALVAMGSLYLISRQSAVIGSYMSEMGGAFGMVFDEIGLAMAPIMEPFLELMWKFADVFAGLPGPVKFAAGAIIMFGMAFAIIGPMMTATNAHILAIMGAIILLGIVWNKWGDDIKRALGPVADKMKQIADFVKNVFGAAFEAARMAILPFKKMMELLWDVLKGIADALGKILGPLGKVGKVAGGIIGGTIGRIPGFQIGGTVPATGMYMMHAGERVIPARAGGGITTTSNITLNIEGGAGVGYDTEFFAKSAGEVVRRAVRRQV